MSHVRNKVVRQFYLLTPFSNTVGNVTTIFADLDDGRPASYPTIQLIALDWWWHTVQENQNLRDQKLYIVST